MPLDNPKPPFSLPKLPYDESALDPVVSSKTISFHYHKHHKAYIDNLNKMIQGTAYEQLTLEEIVKKSAGNDKDKPIFNNSGQTWNHNFYWESMAPKGGAPTGRIADMLKDSFGGVKEFNEAFQKAAVGQFGSGWAWLVKGKDGKLKITTTGNADTPLAHGETALLTCDVWEHAYYLDYQNRRPDHVKDWLEKLANWSFAEKNLG